MGQGSSDVGFVHLHVHSSYSLLEGALKIAELAKLAAADRQPALALTDTNNLFGALEFSEKLAALGIQPPRQLRLFRHAAGGYALRQGVSSRGRGGRPGRPHGRPRRAARSSVAPR